MPWLGQVHAEPLIGKAQLFPMLEYQIHAQEVADFHNSDATIRIASAPARTSKSFSAAKEGVWQVMPTKPLTSSLTWVIGPDYPTNKEFSYYWQDLVDNRERLWGQGKKYKLSSAVNNPTNGTMQIVIEWGKDEDGIPQRAVIQGKSASNERSLQGDEPTMVILSEAAEQPDYIWKKYISTRFWKAILPSTPKPKADWIRDLIEKGENNPGLGIENFTFPPHANPTYSWDRYKREKILAEMRTESGKAEDDPYFAEQFLGRWVYYTGLVLPFDKKRHVVPFNRSWLDLSRIIVSCDYGWRDPAAAGFWAVLPTGAVVLFDEIYEKHLPTADFIKKIDDRLGPYRTQLDYVTSDPQEPQTEYYMREMGLPVISMNKKEQRDRAIGHRRLVDMLSGGMGPDEKTPSLYVTENCVHAIAEFSHLRYRDSNANEYGTTSMEGQDHMFDLARYFVTSRPSPKANKREMDWQEEIRRGTMRSRMSNPYRYQPTRRWDPYRSAY